MSPSLSASPRRIAAPFAGPTAGRGRQLDDPGTSIEGDLASAIRRSVVDDYQLVDESGGLEQLPAHALDDRA